MRVITTRDRQAFEAPLDVGLLTGALRRSRWLIVTIVVGVTAAVLIVSLAAPERYRASARIAEDPTSAEALDIATADRRLATSRELVTSPAVLATAARRLPGETPGSLAAKVSATIDAEASILDVVATDGQATGAARIADAVAATFLARETRLQAAALADARERMTREIERQRRAGAGTVTLDALRERLSELAVTEALAGSRLRLAQPATVPASPYAPRPLLSALLALLAALAVAVLIALARDRVRRSAPDAIALSEVAGLPLLAAVPITGRGLAQPLRRLGAVLRLKPRITGAVDQGMIEEAALQATLRTVLPPRVPRLVVVHDAGPGAGAERVAAGLARSLAWAGHTAVLLRPRGDDFEESDEPDVPIAQVSDPGDIKRRDYRYAFAVSPMAGPIGDVRLLAPLAAGAVLVARLGRTSAPEVASARRLIDALGIHILGLVVTCTAGEASRIPRDAFTGALRPPARTRAAQNGGGHEANGRAPAELPADLSVTE